MQRLRISEATGIRNCYIEREVIERHRQKQQIPVDLNVHIQSTYNIGEQNPTISHQ